MMAIVPGNMLLTISLKTTIDYDSRTSHFHDVIKQHHPLNNNDIDIETYNLFKQKSWNNNAIPSLPSTTNALENTKHCPHTKMIPSLPITISSKQIKS